MDGRQEYCRDCLEGQNDIIIVFDRRDSERVFDGEEEELRPDLGAIRPKIAKCLDGLGQGLNRGLTYLTRCPPVECSCLP